MNGKCITAVFIFLSCLNFISCGGDDSSGRNTTPSPSAVRPFQMGFTPWPYAANYTAQNMVYEDIQEFGDIVSHHIMGGIPWQAALDETAYPGSVQLDLSTRLGKTEDATTIYLSIDSLNGKRDQLALNWGQNENEPRPGPWASRSFASPEVIQAYGNFALNLIDRFEPAYFNYAVEVSVLMVSNPAAFDEFVVFAEAIYTRIKSIYPDLPLLVSLSLKTPGNEEMQIVREGFARIADYVDMVGISIYPFGFFDHLDQGDPRNMPENWLSQISTLAPGKPVAVTETAWAAENLVLDEFDIEIPMTPLNQQQFLHMLFTEAENINAAFIIWFCLYDYDTLWETVLAKETVARIWRDTGLFDGYLNSRPALEVWQTWFQRPYIPH